MPNYVEGRNAHCGEMTCLWYGTERQLIWAVAQGHGFYRCPRCHSDNVWIDMTKQTRESGPVMQGGE